MSIESTPFYWLVCDWEDCAVKSTEDGDFAAWADISQAEEDASNGDWLLTDDGKHYCIEHSHWDDEADERVAGPVEMVSR